MIRIAYTTTFSAQDIHSWSGTPYYMANGFQAIGAQLNYIGNLKHHLPRFFKIKQLFKKYVANQRESPRFNIFAAQHFSAQAEVLLKKLTVDVIVSPLINPIAYLNTTKPIVLWTDALYAALVGFYSPFSKHSAATIDQGNAITQAALARCQLAIFSSDWAANSAIELYGIPREKIHVVPFGANIDTAPDEQSAIEIIKSRPKNKLNLLFLAKSWERKGGDLVLSVAHALAAENLPVTLTIAGQKPPYLKKTPSYIRYTGFIDKNTAAGRAKFRRLLYQSHFLFVPSRAEAYGIVFCEANAYAMPCLSTYVGGISTVIKNNINGMTFPLQASSKQYCDYLDDIMSDPKRYDALALSSYHEYKTRFNWSQNCRAVVNLMERLL